MKTTLLKIATVVLLITAAGKSFAVQPVSHDQFTALNWITSFYKIEVHGNVQLHLISGDKNKVEMKGSYFDHNALVQVEHGVLRITCYKTERLQVWVTVNNLRVLAAYDNVLVQTEGRFSALEFNMDLFNKAKADLNLDCGFTDIKLNGRSMANIDGTAIESELAANYGATLNAKNFLADQETVARVAPIWETRLEYVDCSGTNSLNGLNDERQPATSMKALRFTSATTKQVKFDIPACVNSINITHSLIN